jgi:hypothetical protein
MPWSAEWRGAWPGCPGTAGTSAPATPGSTARTGSASTYKNGNSWLNWVEFLTVEQGIFFVDICKKKRPHFRLRTTFPDAWSGVTKLFNEFRNISENVRLPLLL